MNKILILTTEGCEACGIAKNNINIAILQTSAEIEVETKDWHDVDKDFIKKQRINDFPTVIYFVNNKIVNKAVGTYPSAVYLRWIDIHFKY